MINRTQACILIQKYLKDKDNLRQGLAVECILKKMGELLEKDIELWGIVGLLHNLDYEYCFNNPEKRGTLVSQLLDGLLPDTFINAIKANNYIHTGHIPMTSLDKSLIAAVTAVDFISDIIYKSDSKKIKDITLEEIMIKFNDKNYGTRYNRNRILLCEDVGMQLEFFLNLCLEEMKKNLMN
jgi:uncharacterized protein